MEWNGITVGLYLAVF